MGKLRKAFAEINDLPSWAGGSMLTVSGVMLPDEEGVWPDMQIGDTIKVESPLLQGISVEVRVVYIEEDRGCRRWRAEAEV